MRASRHIADRDIRALPGGGRVIAARSRARGLLLILSAIDDGPDGGADGWEGVQRRGSLDRLLPSEHLHDREEFLRRHLEGEQLYLSRRSPRDDGARALLCWDLTAASLGAPRLAVIGVALALRERLVRDGGGFRLLVGAERSFALSDLADLEELSRLPPSPARAPLEAWRAAIVSGPPARAVIFVASTRDELGEALECCEAIVEHGLAGAAATAGLLAGTRSIELWTRERGSRGPWQRAAAARMGEHDRVEPR